MSQSILVSVIIPVYNGAKWLRETIESVLRQTYQCFEIICVDDESKDESVEILKRIEDPRIKVFSKVNGGPGSARNYGIRNSKGKYIALLDQDDLWAETKLERQLTTMKTGNTSFCYCNAYSMDLRYGTRQLYSDINKPFEGNVFKELFRSNFIVASSVLFEKELLTEVGLFPEDESLIGVDDYALWLQMARKIPFAYLPEPLVVRRIHFKNYSNFSKKSQINMLKKGMLVRSALYHIDKDNLKNRMAQACCLNYRACAYNKAWLAAMGFILRGIRYDIPDFICTRREIAFLIEYLRKQASRFNSYRR